MKPFKLRDYQLKSVKNIRGKSAAALLLEMRLGKTLICIRWLKPKKLKKILIVVPFSGMLGWEADLLREGFDPAKTVRIIGTPTQKREILSSDYQIYLVNYEAYNAKGVDLLSIAWDAVILDEVTYCKNPGSGITKFYTNGNFAHVKTRAILSGTLDPESELNTFHPLQFVDPKILNCRDIWQFRSKYFQPTGLSGKVWKMKAIYKREFRARIAANCEILKRKDVDLGGEQIHVVHEFKLPGPLATDYALAEQEYLIEDRETSDIEWSTKSAGAAYVQMKQLAGGMRFGVQDWDGKCKALVKYCKEDFKKQQIIVWAYFKDEIAAISKYLQGKQITHAVINGDVSKDKRDQIVNKYQLGRTQVLLAQPTTLRFGAKLTRASAMIYYSHPEGSETYEQSKDRAIDVDVKDSMLVIHFITKDTVDENIYDSLKKKYSRQKFNHLVAKQIQKRQDKTS